MARALKPQNSRVRGVVFELDRIELADGHQCELKGRWFGVRGRRFMRPALTLIGEGWRTRLLADLAHKPWDAAEGEPWEAAFEGELEDLELVEAELTVAPDITITLPLSKARTIARKRQKGRGQAALNAGSQSPAAADPADQPRPRDIATQGRLRLLTAELAESNTELRQLRGQFARAEAEVARTAARLDAALGELQAAAQDRDRAREERDQAIAELGAIQQALATSQEELRSACAVRDRAQADRDALRQAHEQAASERDSALDANRQAQSQRDGALAGHAQAEQEREAALAARANAISERDAANRERDDAIAERDGERSARAAAVSELVALQHETERLRSELAQRQATHGAALVMRQATSARSGINAPKELSRAAPLIGLLVILLALALLVALVVL